MSSDPVSPFKFLWQYHFPFEYWDNRLEKINHYNEQDRLEALYCLVQLTDLYAHVFAAYVRNPEMPWFLVKANTFRKHIDDVLDKLRADDIVTVGTLSENPEGLATFAANEEYDLHDLDAIACGLLGCPFTIDEEEESVEFEEPPEIHRGVCNAILNFADEHTALLNDFKHGFRVLPISPEGLHHMITSLVVMDEEDEEAYEETLNQLREDLEDDEWGFSFARMYTESTDYGYEVQLDVYHVDAWSCYKFAELTLLALHNLISPEGSIPLEESLFEVPELVLEGEASIMEHVFGFGVPLRDDPDTVVSEEEFRSG